MSELCTDILIEKEISQLYNNINEEIDVCILELLNRIVDLYKKYTIGSLYLLANKNLFKNKDDEVFDYCVCVNESYKKVLDIYYLNKAEIVSENKKDILKGINNILLSQIKDFKDNCDECDKNPITEEKRNIISEIVKEFEKDYNLIESKCKIEIIEKCKLNENFYFELDYLTLLFEQIEIVLFPNNYKLFLKNKKKSLENINDLEKRKETNKYLEIIKQQQEILSSIIKIQVMPLEKLSNTNEKEEEIINEILKILRQSYQYISKKVDTLSEFLMQAENEILDEQLELNNFKDGFKYLMDKKLNDYFAASNEKFLIITQTKNQLANKIIDVLNKSINKKLNNKITTDIKKFKIEKNKIEKMSANLVSSFKILLNYYSGKKEILSENKNKAIIFAINETIEIKIESIFENLNEFDKNSDSLILSTNNINFSLETLNNEILSKNILEVFYKNFNKEKSLEQIIEDLTNAQIIKDYYDKTIKIIDSKSEKINKFFNNYLREHILNEIVTFQEIETYSISKINEDENITLEIKNYVNIFMKVMNCIDKILQSNEIMLIQPSPHETFNAKEHEVLIAEEKEGFQKGEIIKTFSKGFKKENIILLRANVVAAKG